MPYQVKIEGPSMMEMNVLGTDKSEPLARMLIGDVTKAITRKVNDEYEHRLLDIVDAVAEKFDATRHEVLTYCLVSDVSSELLTARIYTPGETMLGSNGSLYVQYTVTMPDPEKFIGRLATARKADFLRYLVTAGSDSECARAYAAGVPVSDII